MHSGAEETVSAVWEALMEEEEGEASESQAQGEKEK